MATSSPDPAYIQRNIDTLMQIGGLYDLIAGRVETDHAQILEPWRIDNPSKSVADYIRERPTE